MGHSISETLGIWHLCICCLFEEFMMESITAHCGQHGGQQHLFNVHNQRYLVRIVCSNNQMALAENTTTFNAESIRCLFSVFNFSRLWKKIGQSFLVNTMTLDTKTHLDLSLIKGKIWCGPWVTVSVVFRIWVWDRTQVSPHLIRHQLS